MVDQFLAQPSQENPSFPQQMGTNTETHNQTLCRDWENLEHSILYGMSPSNPSCWGSANPAEAEKEEL